MAARADRCGTERGDHTKRQKLYVSVHGSRSDQSPSRELAENRTLQEVQLQRTGYRSFRDVAFSTVEQISR